jgi:hypothetical protein
MKKLLRAHQMTWHMCGPETGYQHKLVFRVKWLPAIQRACRAFLRLARRPMKRYPGNVSGVLNDEKPRACSHRRVQTENRKMKS